MASEPELLYVNSKITEPKKLSPELFTEWYNDEHIPDIFKTSGIKQACRYYTASSNPSSVDRPYLALYPVKAVGYLQSDEFRAIPVLSELLPGPNGAIFDVADFDTRYYKLVTEKRREGDGDELRHLLTVQLDAPSDLENADDEAVAKWYINECSDSSERFRFFKCYFSRQNRLTPGENQLDAPSTYLAIHEFETESESRAALFKSQTIGKVAEFVLLKTFNAY